MFCSISRVALTTPSASSGARSSRTVALVPMNRPVASPTIARVAITSQVCSRWIASATRATPHVPTTDPPDMIWCAVQRRESRPSVSEARIIPIGIGSSIIPAVPGATPITLWK